MSGGEDNPKLVVETHADRIGADPNTYQAATISPDDLIGATYLKDPKEDGQRFRAKVVRKTIELQNGEESIKFLASIDEADQDEIIGYNELIDIIHKQQMEEDEDPDCLWVFKDIIGHQIGKMVQQPMSHST